MNSNPAQNVKVIGLNAKKPTPANAVSVDMSGMTMTEDIKDKMDSWVKDVLDVEQMFKDGKITQYHVHKLLEANFIKHFGMDYDEACGFIIDAEKMILGEPDRNEED